MEHTSIEVGKAALAMAISGERQAEQRLQQEFAGQDIRTVAIDFGGEYLTVVKKVIERAVVAAQRQALVQPGHVGEGAVAGAAHAALEQLTPKAAGLNVGGKIGIARSGEHLCVAIYVGVGVLNLNEVAVGLAHRSLAHNK